MDLAFTNTIQNSTTLTILKIPFSGVKKEMLRLLLLPNPFTFAPIVRANMSNGLENAVGVTNTIQLCKNIAVVVLGFCHSHVLLAVVVVVVVVVSQEGEAPLRDDRHHLPRRHRHG